MPLNPRITDWNGRVAWIVGASSGIGRALAGALHARGARVLVTARQAGALRAFADAHPGSLALPADATDRAALHAACHAALRACGRLDAVFYCAGHYREMRADAFDLDQALRHQQVNYVGALHLLDAVLPVLQRQGRGHLVLTSSVAGYRGLPRSLAYGPTKAALTHLAEVLHLDLAPRGIGVAVVNPGFVATPLTAGNRFPMPALLQPAEAAEAILAGLAAGRFEIHFPRRFTAGMKLLRLLPYPAYFALVRRATGL